MKDKNFSHLLQWTSPQYGMLEIKGTSSCPLCDNEMMFDHWHDYSTNDETFTCSFCGFSFHEHRKWRREGNPRDTGSFYYLIELNRPGIKHFTRAKKFFSKFKSKFNELKFDEGSVCILKSKIGITYFFVIEGDINQELTEDNCVTPDFIQWIYFDFDKQIANFIFEIKNEDREVQLPFNEAYTILTALGIYNEKFSPLEELTRNKIKKISKKNCNIGLAKLKESEANTIKYNYTDW